MITPIEPIRLVSQTQTAPVQRSAPAGFAEGLGEALQSVSNAESQVDALAKDIATGGSTEVHDLMMASSKASLTLDLAVQIRNRAIEAYQEIMRMQI